jgi:protein O-GlcNAc transferase
MNAETLKNQALSLIQNQKYIDALDLLDKAILLQPHFPEAWYHQSFCFRALKNFEQATAALKKLLESHPNLDIGWNALGLIHYETQQLPLALLCFEKAAQLNASNIESWINKSKVLLDQKEYQDAINALHQAYSIDPNYKYLLGTLIFAKLSNCDWGSLIALEAHLIENFTEECHVASPFEILSLNTSADFQKRVAQSWATQQFSQIQRVIIQPKRRDKIRIGYFSSDLRSHPVGNLMNKMLPNHNRSKYEVYGFFLNPETNDEIECSIKKVLDKSFCLDQLSDEKAHRLALEQDLDIAIDLNGYTKGGRMSLFAHGVASIHVNYLGYPATCGSKFHDFIIADRFLIPEDEQSNYSEKVAYLPNCFFPAQAAPSYIYESSIPSRASQNLPENCFIFACFNNAYKIHPSIFAAWLNLLREVQNSVLWLSIGQQNIQKNLINIAELAGVDPARIIFAKREDKWADHLNRLRLIDLFLDTPYYNAHSTAADALSVGVPVLTISGNTFPSRVAGSQLHTLGLSNLIAKDIEEYQYIASEMARKSQLLVKAKRNLDSKISGTLLFDSKKYMQDLEDVLSKMLDVQDNTPQKKHI